MLNSIKAHSIALISIALLLCIGGCAPANEAAAGINKTHLIMATDMSPVEIVSLYFIAQRTDNQELFQSMLAEEFIDDGQALNYGLMSLTIHEISKRFSKTGLKCCLHRRKHKETRQFRTVEVQIPNMAF